MRLLLLASVAALAASAASCDRERGYPDRPIVLICPWAAGGGTDAVSRQMAVFLEQELDVPVNVINATGGAGVTGHSRGARARPDGYTITMMTVEINMLRWRRLTELSWEDFRPLALINRDAAALFVREDAPWKDLASLTEAIRAQPGKLTASGTATGGIWHLALAGWLDAIGLEPSDVNWIPFQGAGPSLQELASGGLDMVCSSLPEAAPLLGGTVRCLGVMADEPVAGFESVPTFRSLGVDWSMGGWRGLAVPQGTPDRVAERLVEAVKHIVTGETAVITERIRSGERTRERLTFPEFMRRQRYDYSWEGPEQFRKTLARLDAELGKMLRHETFASISKNRIRPYDFPRILFGLGGAVLALLAIGRLRRPPPEREASERVPGAALHFVEVVAAVVLYVALAEAAGFIITAFAISFLLLVRLGNHVWVSAAVAGVLSPAVYQVFSYWLGVPLPRGYLGW